MKNSIKATLTIALLFSFVAVGFAQKPEHAGKKDKVEKKLNKENFLRNECLCRLRYTTNVRKNIEEFVVLRF